MPVMIQAESGSAVTEADKDVFTRSYTGSGRTVTESDMRKGDRSVRSEMTLSAGYADFLMTAGMRQCSIRRKKVRDDDSEAA